MSDEPINAGAAVTRREFCGRAGALRCPSPS